MTKEIIRFKITRYNEECTAIMKKQFLLSISYAIQSHNIKTNARVQLPKGATQHLYPNRRKHRALLSHWIIESIENTLLSLPLSFTITEYLFSHELLRQGPCENTFDMAHVRRYAADILKNWPPSKHSRVLLVSPNLKVGIADFQICGLSFDLVQKRGKYFTVVEVCVFDSREVAGA